MELGKDFKKGTYLNGWDQRELKEGEKVIINDEVYVKDNSWNNSRFVKLNNNCWYYPCPNYEMGIWEHIEVKEEQVKTNKYVINNTNKSIIEFDVDGKYITLNIQNRLNIVTVLKSLLVASNLINYKYERISPFKIERNKARDTVNRAHTWDIVFIDVKDDYKEKKENIITLDETMTMEGEYRIFIPDLLEIMVERRLLQRDGKGYGLIKDLTSMEYNIRYLPCKPRRIDLEKIGFVVPEAFDNIK